MTAIKLRFSLLLLATPLAAFAAPSPESASPGTNEVDYGEMYILQKKPSIENPWFVGINYLYGFSNPYIGIHGTQLELGRNLGDFFSLQLSPAIYVTTTKDVVGGLQTQLGVQGIQTRIYRPQYSGHLGLGLHPLSGMLSWLNLSTVHFDFVLGVAGGAIRYDSDPNFVPSVRLQIVPQIMVSNRVGFNLGIQTSFERFPDGEWQNRFDTVLGMLVRF